ncbi:MAG: ABC transporter permease [Rhodothermales bacterium]
MHKIWIILKSEFWRRARSKWFILITLLAPLLILAIIGLPVVLAVLASEGSENMIVVVDETGVLMPHLQHLAEEDLQLAPSEAPIDSVRSAVRAGRYNGYLHFPSGMLQGQETATYYSAEGGGFQLRSRVERLVGKAVTQQRLAERNAPPDVLEIINADVPVRMVKLTEEGEEADSTIANAVVGYVMGFFIYVTVLIYGALVMQGVIEEKASRVVEVMVSSVRPFQLLMGKVLGIGAVGLVQMIVWGGLIVVLSLLAGSVLALFLDPGTLNLPDTASQEAMLGAADFSIPAVSPALFVWFVLFFLGGYLLFSSLYAAVGSAVEQQQDAQALMMPVTLLVIIPILFITFIIESPNSTLAVSLSLIPFFSPILMIVRMAVTEVPFWEVVLSYALLVAGFIGSIWMSSRIYRIGILMYGKKASLKDLARWFRYA